jgi:hypothetical protein
VIGGQGDANINEPGHREQGLVVGDGQRPGHAADPPLDLGTAIRIDALVGDGVADAEPAAGLEHSEGLGQHCGLVVGQVDHAVGDHHVHRPVRQRDVLDAAVQELDVANTCLLGVAARQAQHVGAGIQPVHLAVRTHPAGRQQHVDPTTRSQVQHGLSGMDVRHGHRIAAAQTGPHRAVG